MPRVDGRAAEWLFGGVLVLFALFAPPIGLLFGGFMAYRFDRDARIGLRNAALGCAAVSLLFILFPVGVYAKVLDLLG